jgi:uncharacterized protein (DUF58 family)
VAPREYRHGDDLRRVHWRSTARRGELMVRREEQHWQSSGTLFLDTRRHAYAGEGPGGSFEQAVSITASLGVHLSRAGMGLRFVTDAGQVLPPASFEGALLDALAVVHASTARTLTPGLAAMSGTAGPGREGEGLVIAVFGRMDAGEAQALAAARRGTSTYVAILVDPAETGGPSGKTGGETGDTGRTARLLRAAGWRVAVVGSAAELAAAWTAADQAAEESARGRA